MKKYQIIYADPPWRYDFCKDNADKIERHYQTMKTEEICALKIPSDDNAVLYLWATAPKLLEALQVMKAWGFIYKTQPKSIFRKSSVYTEKKTRHSRKPDYFRNLIAESFSKELNKIELFAREKIDGWDIWGNEIENSIELT